MLLKGIYILYRDNEVVYVGRSNDITKRIAVHKREGKKFDRYETVKFPYYRDRKKAERFLIELYTPGYNKQKVK